MWVTRIISQFLHFHLIFLPLLNTLAATNISERTSPRAYAWTPFYLQELEELEVEFVKNVTRFTSADPNVKLQIELYLQEFVRGSGLMSVEEIKDIQGTQAWKSPICGYRLIDRTAGILKDLVLNQFFNNTFDTTTVINYFKQHGWPSVSDIKDATDAIIRLQNVYYLKPESLSDGWINSRKTPCTFNSRHCLEISKIATATGHHALAIDWLEEAKKRVVSDEEVDPDSIHEALWIAIEEHNKAVKSKAQNTRLFARRITHAPQNSQTAPRVRDIYYQKRKGSSHPIHNDTNFRALCSGINHQAEKDKAKLFCWLETQIHPVFTISPRKMEFLNRNPDVVQIYELVTASQMTWFKSDWFKSANLYLTNTSNREGGGYQTRDFRTSAYAFLSDDTIQSIELKKQIEIMTGIPVGPYVCSENVLEVRITSYSFGGLFAPHFDELDWSTEEEQKDTMATVSIYLNDVEMGGGTAFTALGFAARPIAGSAVLFYSKYNNTQTMHGGCPVLFGEKWIVTKWIGFRDKSRIPKWNPKRKINVKRKKYLV